MDRTLTEWEAVSIGQVSLACRDGARVRWLTESGDIVEGVARHITRNDTGTLLTGEDDVRDGFLRVSATMEWFLPMSQVLTMLDDMTLVIG